MNQEQLELIVRPALLEQEVAVDQAAPVVSLSVRAGDPTILEALIDRTVSQNKIIEDLRRQLPGLAVPYRQLDPRILKAIHFKLKNACTFEEASLAVFGSADFARKIRDWRNKWGLQ